MVYRNPSEQGPKLPVDVLVGVTVPKLRGVNREQDPGAILPVQHQWLENVRLNEDGILVNRGGLAKVNTTAVTLSIRGIWDASPEGHTEQVLALPPPPAAVSPPAGDPVPPSTFTILRPSAQGFYNQLTVGPLAGYFTPQPYTKPQALAGSDTGKYIYGGDGPVLDSYAMTDLAGGVASVTKLVLKCKLRWLGGNDTAGGFPRMKLGCRLSGVDTLSPEFPSTFVDGFGLDTLAWDCTLARPGGGAWTPSDVNAVECIVRFQRNGGSNSFPSWISFLWLEVTHP